MKSLQVTLFAVIFLSLLSSARADSPVWKVSGKGHHLYLGGTMHVLGQEDYPLPDAFDRAYQDSQLVVLETDPQTLQSPAFQPRLMEAILYPGQEDITDHLTPATEQALRDHLSQRGIPMAQVVKLRPGMLSTTLTLMEMQTLGQAGTGVDEYYRQAALGDGRTLAYLEGAEQQLQFLAALGEGNEDAFLAYTLDEMERLPEMLDSMKRAWRGGNNQRLADMALTPMARQFPDVYQSLLVDRNRDWLPQIEAMLATVETEFVLFGALHLVGDDGILAMLRRQGYEVINLH